MKMLFGHYTILGMHRVFLQHIFYSGTPSFTRHFVDVLAPVRADVDSDDSLRQLCETSPMTQ